MGQSFLTLVSDLLARVVGSVTIVSIIGFFFWNADNLISKSGKELLEKLLTQSINDPERSDLRRALLNFLNKYFSPNLGEYKFITNVALLTITSMIIMLVFYIGSMGGFFMDFYKNNAILYKNNSMQLFIEYFNGAIPPFLRQFLLDGFIVTFIVNYIYFSLYSIFIERADLHAFKWNVATIFLDVTLKIVLFIFLTTIVYIGFAYYFGSFQGNVLTAAKAAIPTIANALRFENLTAVYLYSVAISSLPVFLILLINLLMENSFLRGFVSKLFFWSSFFEGHPMRSIASVLGIFLVVFFQVSNAVVAFV